MNLDEIRELILLLDQTSISELEVQKDNFKISLRKGSANSPQSGSCRAIASQPLTKEADVKLKQCNLH